MLCTALILNVVSLCMKVKVPSFYPFPVILKKKSPKQIFTHSHTMTPFDAPGKQAF